MGSRFRLRISKVIPSICCSKGHSRKNAIPNSLPSQFSTVFPTLVPKPKPRRSSSIGRHVSRALTSCGMKPGSKPALSSDELEPTTCRLSHWRKEEKYWQVMEITETPRRKVYASVANKNDDVVSPPPPSVTEKRHVSRQRRRVTLEPKFTEKPTEALVSSDSKENDNDKTTTRKKKKKKRTRSSRSLSESEWSTPARLSVFQRMIPCRVEGKVRESFAVVKRSEDPYEDFKRSMTEMILEKQMFDDDDLEQLLHCFLSLNSKRHHGLIVEAFVEIWEALFSGSVRSTVSSTPRLSRAL